MQGFIDGAVSVRYGYDSRVEIIGTKGVLFVGRLRENEVVVCSQNAGIVTPFMETWRTLFIDAYRKEDEEFIESIVEDKTPRVTGIDGKMAVKVVNAGNQSILEKRPVQL